MVRYRVCWYSYSCSYNLFPDVQQAAVFRIRIRVILTWRRILHVRGECWKYAYRYLSGTLNLKGTPSMYSCTHEVQPRSTAPLTRYIYTQGGTSLPLVRGATTSSPSHIYEVPVHNMHLRGTSTPARYIYIYEEHLHLRGTSTVYLRGTSTPARYNCVVHLRLRCKATDSWNFLQIRLQTVWYQDWHHGCSSNLQLSMVFDLNS